MSVSRYAPAISECTSLRIGEATGPSHLHESAMILFSGGSVFEAETHGRSLFELQVPGSQRLEAGIVQGIRESGIDICSLLVVVLGVGFWRHCFTFCRSWYIFGRFDHIIDTYWSKIRPEASSFSDS